MPGIVERWLLFKYVGGEFTPLSKPLKTKELAEKQRLKYPERKRKMIGIGLWNGDSAPNCLSRRVRVGWGVSEALQAFVTSLARLCELGLTRRQRPGGRLVVPVSVKARK